MSGWDHCPRCHGSGYATHDEPTYGGTVTQTCHCKPEGTTMKLSDLAGPDAAGWSDVAVFVRPDGSESEPFVVTADRGQGYVGIEYPDSRAAKGGGCSVRRLGRGRLVPARIEMEGEVDLAAQVATLRKAMAKALRGALARCGCNRQERYECLDCDADLAMLDSLPAAALAATAPKDAAS